MQQPHLPPRLITAWLKPTGQNAARGTGARGVARGPPAVANPALRLREWRGVGGSVAELRRGDPDDNRACPRVWAPCLPHLWALPAHWGSRGEGVGSLCAESFAFGARGGSGGRSGLDRRRFLGGETPAKQSAHCPVMREAITWDSQTTRPGDGVGRGNGPRSRRKSSRRSGNGPDLTPGAGGTWPQVRRRGRRSRDAAAETVGGGAGPRSPLPPPPPRPRRPARLPGCPPAQAACGERFWEERAEGGPQGVSARPGGSRVSGLGRFPAGPPPGSANGRDRRRKTWAQARPLLRVARGQRSGEDKGRPTTARALDFQGRALGRRPATWGAGPPKARVGTAETGRPRPRNTARPARSPVPHSLSVEGRMIILPRVSPRLWPMNQTRGRFRGPWHAQRHGRPPQAPRAELTRLC